MTVDLLIKYGTLVLMAIQTFVFVFFAFVYYRQTKIMSRQAEILDRQVFLTNIDKYKDSLKDLLVYLHMYKYLIGISVAKEKEFFRVLDDTFKEVKIENDETKVPDILQRLTEIIYAGKCSSEAKLKNDILICIKHARLIFGEEVEKQLKDLLYAILAIIISRKKPGSKETNLISQLINIERLIASHLNKQEQKEVLFKKSVCQEKINEIFGIKEKITIGEAL